MKPIPALLAVGVAVALLPGCSKKEPPPRLVQAPPPSLKAVAQVVCPGCGARLRPEELVRAAPGSPVAACPKCKARIPPPGAAAPPK